MHPEGISGIICWLKNVRWRFSGPGPGEDHPERERKLMPVVSVWIENVWRYLLLTRFTDVLDVALMAFLLYKLLTLLKTTSGTNLLKGVLIFLAVLLSETGLGLDPLLERLGGRKGRNAAG